MQTKSLSKMPLLSNPIISTWSFSIASFSKQHFLYFFPLPQGQRSFLPIFGNWSFQMGHSNTSWFAQHAPVDFRLSDIGHFVPGFVKIWMTGDINGENYFIIAIFLIHLGNSYVVFSNVKKLM